MILGVDIKWRTKLELGDGCCQINQMDHNLCMYVCVSRVGLSGVCIWDVARKSWRGSALREYVANTVVDR